MQLTLEADDGVFLIRAYSDSGIQVGDRTLVKSCIIAPDRLTDAWDVRAIETLQLDQFAPVFEQNPEVILLGSGERQQFAPEPVRAVCHERGIGLETMTLGAACRTYNVLVQEGRRAVAALILPAPETRRPP